MKISGGTTFGNCATGNPTRVTRPTMTMMMEITMATMGRLMKNFDMGLAQSSADFQSAVSRISNPQTLQVTERADSLKLLPIGNRRYSRLETCATHAAQGPSRSADFQSAGSRISNPQTLQVTERADSLNLLPIG